VVHPIPYLGKGLSYSPQYNGIVLKFPRGFLNNCDSDSLNLGYALGNYRLSPTVEASYYRAYLACRGSKTANVALKFHAFSYSTSKRFYSSIKSYFQYDSYTQEYLSGLINDYDLLFVNLQLLNPLSKGYITYKDSIETPYIDLGFYTEEEDLLTMLEAIEQTKTLATTSVFKSLGAELVQLPLNNIPGDFFTNEFNRQSLLYNSYPTLYPAGGLPMGIDYQTAVVDKALRVLGTTNLRILNSCVSPYPLESDSIAFNTLIGMYGAEVIINELNGITYDTISVTDIASSSYSSRDIDITSPGGPIIPTGPYTGPNGTTSYESSTSSTDIDIDSSSTNINSYSSGLGGVNGSSYQSSSSSTDIDLDSSSTSINSYSSGLGDASGSSYQSSSSSTDIDLDSSSTSINNYSSGLGGASGSSYQSSSSSADISSSASSVSSSNLNAAGGSVVASEYSSQQSQYEASQQSSNASYVAGGAAGASQYASQSESYSAESEYAASSSYQSGGVHTDVLC
jgi:hypothetical protein